MAKKILLIDDDELVLKSTRKLLERQGYEVFPASSAKEALQLIDNDSLDLVISDIRMPDKNGVEIVSEIQSCRARAGKKDLPIIFITGYAAFGQELHATFLGEILYKPFDSEKLLAAIRDYL